MFKYIRGRYKAGETIMNNKKIRIKSSTRCYRDRFIAMILVASLLISMAGITDFIRNKESITKVQAAAHNLAVGDYIYLYTAFISGDNERNWQSDSAKIYFRYWNGSEQKVLAESVSEDYVRVQVTQAMKDANYFQWHRYGPDGTSRWNRIGRDNNDFTISSVPDNCNVFKIDGWGDGSEAGSWKSNGSWPDSGWMASGNWLEVHTDDPSGDPIEVELSDDFRTKIGNGDVIAVKATYFDYVSDYEHQMGWLNNYSNIKVNNSTWFPFTDFNEHISSVASSGTVKLPMYFGNFYNDSGKFNYGGEISGLYNYNDAVSTDTSQAYYDVNNSNGLADYHQSIQGLAGAALDSDGDIVYSGTNVKMPYFDKAGLKNASVADNKVYAKIIESYFPFRKTIKQTTSGGDTIDYAEYSFDSTGATDNVFFNWDGFTPQSVGYGAGTDYGVIDSASKFGGSNDYGIFPFNNSALTKGNRGGNDNTDYGFGVRLDIDFSVPTNGTVDGTAGGLPVKFEYSGDDDMFVYFGEKAAGAELVLDLGGAHKQAGGSIDFQSMTATVDNSYKSYVDQTYIEEDGNKKVTRINGGNRLDPGKVYHMTVFYMERGLGESNFTVNYTLQPVSTGFKMDKTIDTGSVADSIADVLKEKESFEYTVKKYSGENLINISDDEKYTRIKSDGVRVGDQTVSTGSKLNLKDSEAADFGNSLTINTKLKVVENLGSSNPKNALLEYSPSWSLHDLNTEDDVGTTVDETLIEEDSSETSEFTLVDRTNPSADPNIELRYVNTLSTTDLQFNKETKFKSDTSKNYIDNTSTFSAKLLLNLGVNLVDDEEDAGYELYNAPLYSALDDSGKANARAGNGNYKVYAGIKYSINSGAQQTLGNTGTIQFKSGDTVTIKNLPKGAGYLIVEDNPSDTNYDTGVVVDGIVSVGEAATLTNYYNIPKTSYTVEKKWKLPSGADDTTHVPGSVKVLLQRKESGQDDSEYADVGTAFTLTGSTWTHTFTLLDTISTNNKSYIYRVMEMSGDSVIGTGESIKLNYGSPGVNGKYDVTYSHDMGNKKSVITNTYVPAKISVTKVDATDPTTKLGGVSFTLERQGDSSFGTVTKTTPTTGASLGIIEFDNLEDGTYILTETVAKEGYSLLKSPITIVIDRSEGGNCTVDGETVAITDETISLTVKNQAKFRFPDTGGVGVGIYRLAGLMMILMAVILYVVRRRRCI